MRDKIKAAFDQVVERALAFYRAYPARSVSYVVAALVALGGVLGVTVDADGLSGLLTLVLPILLGGEAVHRQVTPVAALPEAVAPDPVVRLDSRKVAKAVAKHGDVDAPHRRAAAPDAPKTCRHGHPIDGSNGAYCGHGHPAEPVRN